MIPAAGNRRAQIPVAVSASSSRTALDIIQPDLANTGEITETKKICDVGIQAHVRGGPIAMAAALHVEATISNFVIHEEQCQPADQTQEICEIRLRSQNGFYELPELPGIGQKMNISCAV